jgi:hypothetical protein
VIFDVMNPMKVCGTESSEPPSGSKQETPATPRPDRLRRNPELACQRDGQPQEGLPGTPNRDRTLRWTEPGLFGAKGRTRSG